jgi:hypothetical protein
MSNVPGWASESEARTPLPAWLCHWERAVMLLVGAGVRRSDWPSPYIPDSSPESQWTRATEEQRRALLPKCEALRCEIHAGFAHAEIESAIQACREKPRWHGLLFCNSSDRAVFRNPRAITTEDARYICAEDATAQLLHQEVLPHRWPTAYELTDANGKHPVRVPNGSDGAGRLFTGKGSGSLYVLGHELRQLLPNVEVVGSAADAITRFNESQRNLQYDLARGFNAERNRARAVDLAALVHGADDGMRQFRDQYAQNDAVRRQNVARSAPLTTSIAKARATAVIPVNDAKSRASAKRTKPEWHLDAAAILDERPGLNAEALIEELFRRHPARYDRENDAAGELQLIPSGTGRPLTAKTVQNWIADRRKSGAR